MSEKTASPNPAFRNDTSALSIIGSLRKPGSVTSSGRFMPSSLHTAGSSAMRPGPKRTDVG